MFDEDGGWDSEGDLSHNPIHLHDESASATSLKDFSSSLKNHNGTLNLLDKDLETVDPNPDIRALFLQYNEMFFDGILAGIEVKWSPRMTLCAGVCSFDGQLCSVRLSEPLLKLRPRSDLVNTLLHEMIHAYLFLRKGERDRDAHGPNFHSHMERINRAAGTRITVYHTFQDEVKLYRTHHWRCNGTCQHKPPYYGYVKRAMNRPPSVRDPWWNDHQMTCGGQFLKIKEPEKPPPSSKKKPAMDGSKGSTTSTSNSSKPKNPTLDDFFVKNESARKKLKQTNESKTSADSSIPLGAKNSHDEDKLKRVSSETQQLSSLDAFSCPFCPVRFSDLDDLQAHVETCLLLSSSEYAEPFSPPQTFTDEQHDEIPDHIIQESIRSSLPSSSWNNGSGHILGTASTSSEKNPSFSDSLTAARTNLYIERRMKEGSGGTKNTPDMNLISRNDTHKPPLPLYPTTHISNDPCSSLFLDVSSQSSLTFPQEPSIFSSASSVINLSSRSTEVPLIDLTSTDNECEDEHGASHEQSQHSNSSSSLPRDAKDKQFNPFSHGDIEAYRREQDPAFGLTDEDRNEIEACSRLFDLDG